MPPKLERREIIEHMKKYVISAEEILDLKDDLESRIVDRAKGSGLRPTSVQDARLALELKKKEHKNLWKDIEKKYYPFLMDIQITQPLATTIPVANATPVRNPPVARATPVRNPPVANATPVREPPIARMTPVRNPPVARDTADPDPPYSPTRGIPLVRVPTPSYRPPPQSEPEPVKSRSRRRRSGCCGSRPRMKKRQTKRRNKKQSRRYKKMKY